MATFLSDERVSESRSVDDQETKKSYLKKVKVIRCAEGDSVEDIKFREGDVKKFMVKGISTIEFSNRIQQILFKEMETTVMLKLLGCNIGYAALYNQIISLWRPPKSFHLMDIENEYFLAKL
ncbi:hypothetical protein Gotri_026713 [Gossypium trilobum]|uniref:Uncharacterized protein n=1 Tax=Gossypium trilobum TaxID=34281 RepID=A0A7J9FSJ6_9ROSI|nr:hypothetical protein [Gossypium trilobum]